MSNQFSEHGEALHDELTTSLSVFQERCYQKASFLQNEFATKTTALVDRELITEDEASRLNQACSDRIRNVFVLYDTNQASA